MKKSKNRTKTKKTTERVNNNDSPKVDLPVKTHKEKPKLIHDNYISETIA